MKTIAKLNLLFLGLFLISLTNVAARPQSELNLKMFDNSVFSVHFNNQIFQNAGTSFSLSNLKPGNHYLKVIKHVNAYGPRGGRHIQSQMLVVYSGWIKIPASTQVFAMIGKYNNYKVLNMVSLKQVPPPSQPHYGYTTTTYNYHNNEPVYSTGYNCTTPVAPAFVVMSDNNFMALKNTIANTAFDSNRLMIAKQAAANNYLTASQVAQLASMLSFESSRLDLAKSAYINTLDKQNYFLLNNVFSFSSSVYELNRYISTVG